MQAPLGSSGILELARLCFFLFAPAAQRPVACTFMYWVFSQYAGFVEGIDEIGEELGGEFHAFFPISFYARFYSDLYGGPFGLEGRAPVPRQQAGQRRRGRLRG